MFTDDGLIQLAANTSLCLSGPSSSTQQPYQLTIEQCTFNNSAQVFRYINSTSDPYATVFQGNNVLGTSGYSLVVFPPNYGAGLFACNDTSLGQHIVFTGGGNIPGQLRNALDQCVSGRCDSPACYPVPFVACNASDINQFWTHDFQNAFVNTATGDCLDAYNSVV